MKKIDFSNKFRQVNHPNVVRFLGLFTDPDGTRYIVNEFVSGGSLRDFVIENSQLTEQNFLDM
jgi:serine/threonine protein kinase